MRAIKHYTTMKACMTILLAVCTLALCCLTGCGRKSHAPTAAEISEIHNAAKGGDLATVKEMLKDNPDLVSSRDTNGYPPLHWAAFKDRKDVVALLLANKADINAKDDVGLTALHLAAIAEHKDMVELLLANKADVNAKDNSGMTPLSWVLEQKDMVALLRQHGGHE